MKWICGERQVCWKSLIISCCQSKTQNEKYLDEIAKKQASLTTLINILKQAHLQCVLRDCVSLFSFYSFPLFTYILLSRSFIERQWSQTPRPPHKPGRFLGI